MTTQFINEIVGQFNAIQYRNQGIEAAIPAPSTLLARIRVQLRRLPQETKATLFARDTMATWFRMTGVGTPIERTQDNYKLDQIKAIEISCRHKLREYQIDIPPGMTARATLMGHIFDRVVLNIGPNRAYEIMQLRDNCAIERRESRLTPTRMLYMKLLADRVATSALSLLFTIFRHAVPIFMVSFVAPVLCVLYGALWIVTLSHLGVSNINFLIAVAGVTASISFVFAFIKIESLERQARVLDFRFQRWALDRLDNRNDAYIAALLGHAKQTWLQITCEGEQQNGAPQ